VTTAAEATPAEDEGPVFVEARWPIALVVGAYIALAIVLGVEVPHRPRLGPEWLVPAIEIALLAALVLADPNHITRRSRWLRKVGITLTVALMVVTLIATGVLIRALINGGEAINDADVLLASGALVWLGNVMVFSLLYWQLDSGGPLARYRHERQYPDFLFPQQASPEFAPPGWRPKFPDYLILGLTTNTAFSPTDVMPMALWAKLTMALQSLIALVVVGLVVARAVNLFA
jgi:hypothetical protein